MIKDDDKLIWEALISEEHKNPDADTYDAEGELPGPIAELDPDIEDEEGGCPNLDKLIASSESDEEDDDDTVVARQGRGATAAQFKAADDTEFG